MLRTSSAARDRAPDAGGAPRAANVVPGIGGAVLWTHAEAILTSLLDSVRR
ncbi:hypothetical protein [Streptomyces flaveolus]|uniref:hypothetical protein n=1 Tax=Streptomyces flaveolus TaxID=67297 RepID=UPI0036F8C9A5